MEYNAFIEKFLDRHFGTMSPNLPTRVLLCGDCHKVRSLKQLEKGVCHGHRLGLAQNTIWNCLITMILK